MGTDVPQPMHLESVQILASARIDWKAIGYLVSILSVLFLGAVAWPKPDAPWWNIPALLIGMATSIAGMACRYRAHLDQKREIERAKAEAKRA
jgi:hypothetical protein